jgi:tetratricopeptide (TPR) repeat protein
MPDTVVAEGSRSAAVGRDLIGLLITGDSNKVFLGIYENLSDAYIYPGAIFEQVNLGRFVGRTWLVDIIDSFMEDHDRGYILLEADAGLGKTAFMAWLTSTRNYLHAFCGLNPDEKSQLKNLASQIIVKFDLGEKEILTPAASRYDYFYGLLERAVGKLKESEKIIIIIDGIDETFSSDLKMSKEILWLPKVLPKGVYFIVSQRPVGIRLQIDTARTPRSVIRFSEHADKNLEDMCIFLKDASKWPRISELLDKSNITSDQFAASLLKRCRGVWIYLNFIIYEIEQGKRTPLDLNALPVGLFQYYASYWSQWRDMDDTAWYNIYMPVLTTLAKIQESVTIETLINLAEINIEPHYLRRIIKENWRPFLTISPRGKEHIRFYHATLQDFFEGHVEREDLTSTERAFIDELSDAAKEVDNRIVKYYLDSWGGLEEDLPELNNISKQEIDEGYGLHRLSYHMFHRIVNAGKNIDTYLKNIDEFLYLISNPTWWQARHRNDPAGSELLEDFEWAILGAMGGQIATLPHYISASYLKARLTSQISNLPLEILEAYAILGLSNQAIDLSNSLATIEQRTSAFFRLATWYVNHDDSENASHLLDKVETGLREIPKNDAKPKNWADIAEVYYKIGKREKFESCLKEAYDLINEEQDEFKCHSMIMKFLNSLSKWDNDQLRPILETIEKFAHDIQVSEYHARIMMALAKEFHRIDTTISADLARKAIAESSPSEIEFETADLERLFSHRNAFLMENIGELFEIGLEERALEMMETINKRDQRINALINLANFLISINRSSDAQKYLDQVVENIQYLEGLSQNQIKMRIIDLLLKINNLSKAKEFAVSIPLENIDRVSAFSNIAYDLAEKGEIEKASIWIERVGTEWGVARCKAVIGIALVKRDLKSAYLALNEALHLSKSLREGIVGSKNDVYTVIATGIRDLASANPDKARMLLHEIIEDIQKEDGRHAIEINSIRQKRDRALYDLSSAILSVDRTCDQYIVEFSENIENSILKGEAILLCIRAACKDGDFDLAEAFLEKLGMSCWKLIAQITIEGWKTSDSQRVRDYLEFNEESISKHCNEHIPFIDPLGTISLELGIADHIDVSRYIWNKSKGPIDRRNNQLIKIRLIFMLMQDNKIKRAFKSLRNLEKGYYRAEALAIIAGFYSKKNLRGAKILYRKAYKELIPEESELDIQNKNGNYDEALFILAGTVARWDIGEANRIISDLIRKEEYRKRARGEIILALSIKDPDEAYSALVDFIEEGAKGGLAEFWESLSLCSEALCNMIQSENIKNLLLNIMVLENYR